MITLVTDAQAKAVRFDADTMWVDLEDCRQLEVPLAYFPRLLNDTPAQRENLTISGGGKRIHWDDLDENFSIPFSQAGIGDRTRKSA